MFYVYTKRDISLAVLHLSIEPNVTHDTGPLVRTDAPLLLCVFYVGGIRFSTRPSSFVVMKNWAWNEVTVFGNRLQLGLHVNYSLISHSVPLPQQYLLTSALNSSVCAILIIHCLFVLKINMIVLGMLWFIVTER